MTDTAIIALAGVVTTIAGFLFQAWQMKTKFAQQQATEAAAREALREETRRVADTLQRTTASTAAELKRETILNRQALTTHASEIKDELRENSKLTGMAYNAANNFEMKLEKLAKVFDSVHTDREVTRQLLELTADTNQTVHKDIQPDVAVIKGIVERDGEPGAG